MNQAQLYKIVFSDKRFASRENVKIYAEVFTLFYYGIHFFKRKIEFVSVFRRPATRTVKIAGGRRIHKDRPRNVAVQTRSQLLFFLPSGQDRVQKEVFKHGLYHVSVNILPDAPNELVHTVVRIVDQFSEHRAL